ncbi:hypothetical protein GRX01_02195 [Halobaculum sp. WSA2]|uniref:Uncharacterized protein n=1 Tax=Halobaculum saliterrae TaxID=2073113 RepID=A0A6B0T0N1_9EURY|nr:hypothetical protein [Halobaculum saliterrae]MXR40169.1 hypothetical protein [Halobaculum saliterrae]
MAGSHPLAGYTEFWDDVMADMEATAEEYREAGWDVLELHPGDVTPLPNVSTDGTGIEVDRTGFDVLLPGDEFSAAQELVEELTGTDGTAAAFDEYDAYRAQQSEVVFLVVVMKAEAAGEAVAFPLYYAERQAEPMLERAEAAGELRAYLRPLDDSERVVFSLSDPGTLYPEDWGEPTDEE